MVANAVIRRSREANAWLSDVRYKLIDQQLSHARVWWYEKYFPRVTRRALLLKQPTSSGAEDQGA